MKMLSALISAAYIQMQFRQVLIMETETDSGQKSRQHFQDQKYWQAKG